MDPKQQKILMDNIEMLAAKTNNYDELVRQLLDQNVVTKKQLDYIDTNVPSDQKAKELYILITKRGPNAFSKLYNIFFKTGNSELAFIINTKRSSNTDIPFPVYDGAGLNLSEEYRLDSNPKGMVLIVNIERLPIRNEIRTGSPQDVKNLTSIWESLGHQVVTYINLDKEQFEDKFIQFIQDFNGDCFTLFLMSHGKQDVIKDDNVLVEMYDSKDVESNWIVKQLSSHNAPHLSEIPKLIFIVSCRGDIPEYGTDINKAMNMQRELQDMRNTEYDGVQVRVRPIISNLLLVYPCSPGYVSHRDVNYGSWFVQDLVNVIKNFADKETLEDMLKRVDRVLLNSSIFYGRGFQTVNIKAIGFNKRLFLKPQKHSNNV